MAAISQLLSVVRLGRITESPIGEFVLDRGIAQTQAVAVSGTLYLTHFTALETETVASLRTGMGGSGSVAVDTTDAWLMIFGWDGATYTLLAESESDDTLWDTADITYDTDLWQAGHAGEAGFEGWEKTAGRDYAYGVLWIGTGQTPALVAANGWYQDSSTAPRTNAIYNGQTGPPATLDGAFSGPDSRRFQALMLAA